MRSFSRWLFSADLIIINILQHNIEYQKQPLDL